MSYVMHNVRTGQKIRIIKVNSHIGIKGNEQADKLAHDACETINCHVQVLQGLPIRQTIHWPIQSQPGLTASLALYEDVEGEATWQDNILSQSQEAPWNQVTAMKVPQTGRCTTSGRA